MPEITQIEFKKFLKEGLEKEIDKMRYKAIIFVLEFLGTVTIIGILLYFLDIVIEKYSIL